MPRKGQPGGQHTGRWVAYYRVSTDEQGRSGLGIDAQKAAVANHLNGGQWIMVAEFTEVESGKRDDRPELTKALAACKKHKAKLVIAKLDRLSRNVHFISGLMDAGVEFVAADMPFANKLTVHIMAAFAQHERERISERTREALVAAKARGVKLGGPEFMKASRLGTAKQREQADQFAANILPLIRELQDNGVRTYREIARTLTLRGIKTARGGQWSPVHVCNILKRTRASP